MLLFCVLDLLLVTMTSVVFLLVNKDIMGRLTPQQLLHINDVTERNIAANTTTRTIQGGLTIGGFLFVGFFSSLFQARLASQVGDIILGLFWTSSSLIAGVTNIVRLPVSMLSENFAATPVFRHLLCIQFVAIIGAFVRLSLLIFKSLSPLF